MDFQNISIQRKGKKVLDDFSLKAPDGVILALLGEDKEGKSTLLKAASGGEKPETGDIYIDGISIMKKAEMRTVILAICLKNMAFTVC